VSVYIECVWETVRSYQEVLEYLLVQIIDTLRRSILLWCCSGFLSLTNWARTALSSGRSGWLPGLQGVLAVLDAGGRWNHTPSGVFNREGVQLYFSRLIGCRPLGGYLD
jgi:hypothetical protein